MNKYIITFSDSRFDDMGLTGEERVALLLDMLKAGTLDLSDAHVSGLHIVEGDGVG